MSTPMNQPGAVRQFFQALAQSRSRRVMVLIAGVVILSIGDLIVTVGHLQTIGMMEANPIAAWLIKSTDTPLALISYKLGTVGICVALLIRVRKHIEGEIAAWFALAILVGMSFMWHGYSEQFDSPEEVHLAQIGEYGDSWLFLE